MTPLDGYCHHSVACQKGKSFYRRARSLHIVPESFGDWIFSRPRSWICFEATSPISSGFLIADGTVLNEFPALIESWAPWWNFLFLYFLARPHPWNFLFETENHLAAAASGLVYTTR